MLPEVLDVWVDAIQSWDGEEEAKLTAFIATIRAAMAEHDNDAAYTMIHALMDHDLQDTFLLARLCLYSALTGPALDAEALLEMATDMISHAAGVAPDNPAIVEWQQKIAKVQSKLQPVDDGNDFADLFEAAVEKSTPAHAGPTEKKPKFLTKATTPKIVEPVLSLDGTTDPAEPSFVPSKKSKQSLLSKDSVQAQVEQRIQDQKRRQKLSKLPPSQRRAAANKSFALREGTAGTLRKAPSKIALFDLFKKEESVEKGAGHEEGASSGEPAGSTEDVEKGGKAQGKETSDVAPAASAEEQVMDLDMVGLNISDDEVMPPSPASAASSMASGSGAGMISEEEEEKEDMGGMDDAEETAGAVDLAGQYNQWVQEAGVADSAQEYAAAYTQHLEDMKRLMSEEKEERSMDWE